MSDAQDLCAAICLDDIDDAMAMIAIDKSLLMPFIKRRRTESAYKEAKDASKETFEKIREASIMYAIDNYSSFGNTLITHLQECGEEFTAPMITSGQTPMEYAGRDSAFTRVFSMIIDTTADSLNNFGFLGKNSAQATAARLEELDKDLAKLTLEHANEAHNILATATRK